MATIKNEMELIGGFIDIDAYQANLTPYDNPHVQWRQLKPRP